MISSEDIVIKKFFSVWALFIKHDMFECDISDFRFPSVVGIEKEDFNGFSDWGYNLVKTHLSVSLNLIYQ